MAVPLFAAAAWVCAEYARSHALTGNPFVLLGYSQANMPWMRQIADVTGVYGVTFVLAATNAAIAEALLARWRGTRHRDAIAGLVVATLLMALAAGYGQWRLTSRESTGTTEVLLVQGNLDLGSQWRDDLYGRNLDVYLRMTIDGLKEGAASLVVWPENSMTFFVAREPLYRLSIGRALAAHPVQLLAGGPHFIEEENRYLNSAFLIGAGGQVTGRYDKEKLLPFAEYFPFPQLDVLQRNFGRVRQFSPGVADEPLPTAAGAAGIMICNEAMFPEIAARRVRAGAEVLVNLANDSWISDAQYAELALDMAILRAVEQRRYVIRSSTSGPSAIVDAQGRVLARTEPGTKAILHGAVRRSSDVTPYNVLGDSFTAACAIMVLLALGRARFRTPAA
jgi:apolipoprotein N-acyltransferase